MKKLSPVSIVLLFFLALGCTKSNLKKWAEKCNSGDSAACLSAAAYYHNDYKESSNYYNKACNLYNAAGCRELGLQYLLIGKNSQQAVDNLQKSCALNPADKGCWWLGTLYSRGLAVSTNYKIAAEVWTKACNAGDSKSCLGLAELFRRGEGVNQDLLTAKKIYQLACNHRDLTGCVYYVELENKIGGTNGIMLYQQGLNYESGNGVRKNKNKAVEFFTESCSGGFAAACLKLGSLLANNNFTESYYYLNRGCTLGMPASCLNAGLLIIRRAQNNPANNQLARSLLTTACSSNVSAACMHLQNFTLEVTGKNILDYAHAAAGLNPYCRDKNYRSCYPALNLILSALAIGEDSKSAAGLKCSDYGSSKCNGQDKTVGTPVKNPAQHNTFPYFPDFLQKAVLSHYPPPGVSPPAKASGSDINALF